jgi:hypothetical protein
MTCFTGCPRTSFTPYVVFWRFWDGLEACGDWGRADSFCAGGFCQGAFVCFFVRIVWDQPAYGLSVAEAVSRGRGGGDGGAQSPPDPIAVAAWPGVGGADRSFAAALSGVGRAQAGRAARSRRACGAADDGASRAGAARSVAPSGPSPEGYRQLPAGAAQPALADGLQEPEGMGDPSWSSVSDR